MTVEMKFENNEQLKLFDLIVDKGLEAYKNENCEICLRMNSKEYSNNMKAIEDIELTMKPIKQKIKYIEDYNRYLELKKIFEPVEKV